MEPILNLSPQEFRAALAELQLDPQREADLVRLYEEANAPQQGGRDRGMLRNLLDNIIGFDDEVVTPGERLGAGAEQFASGLLSDPLGMAGDIAQGGYETIERAMAPGATPMDVMGAAGMAMLGGGMVTGPRGAMRSGLLRDAADETPAQQVARLLREGRADEVTDDLMAQADPQEMFRLYEAGETGMDLPLDRQSRFQRAREMGFDVDNILYHGTAADFPAFDASRGGSVTGARSARAATWLSDDPDVAQGYATFAADRAVQDLIDRSYRAEVDGDFDLAERLMREAERVEAAGVEGANIISAYGPRNLRRVDMAGEQYDPDDMSLSGLLSKAQQSGASGLELTEFIDNADFANMRSASHRGIFNPANIRSEFARFDPRLSNLRNLSAANVDPLTGAVAVSASQQDDPLANLKAYIAAAGGVLPR
jgi:hypothetical protein